MKNIEYGARIQTPFGLIGIVCNGDILSRIDFLDDAFDIKTPDSDCAAEVCRQLEQYFRDPEYQFTIPYEAKGTPFQQAVWHLMLDIACGNARTYGDLAKDLQSAPRAVGQACGANPIPIVIPCHRVVGKSNLGGFANHASGHTVDIKHWLLQHEMRGASK